MISRILRVFLLLGVFSTSIKRPLIEHACDITQSIIDHLDDVSMIECGWKNAASLHNFYSNLINRNKKILNLIDSNGDYMNKLFKQYYDAVRGEDCFKLAMLNKRLIRHLNRSFDKNC